MRIFSKNQTGISFIELIIFIVILSTSLTAITLIYINATRSSADPMIRIRAVELAQSTLEEILLKKYDENTPIGGGCVRFPNAGNSRCVPPTFASNNAANNETTLGNEEGGDRRLFDDVDDYHNLLYCGGASVNPANTGCPALTCSTLIDESGTDISTEYAGFSICIKVAFAGGAGNEINNVSPGTGTNVLSNDAKRIDVIVTDPVKSQVFLSGYRLNF